MLESFLTHTLEEILGNRFEKATYLIGVSGGSDSVALLHAATQVLPKAKLTVAHFNHLTRGEASNTDEEFVRDLAEKYALPIVVERRKKSGVSEAALRRERREFLKKEAKERNTYILLAHHLDDQLETFLFRLIRGSQLKGLMGMQPKNGRFIRPLLSVSKQEIAKYAKKNGLEHREDTSNFEETYFRNRIRLTLTPALFELAKRYGGSDAFYRRFNHLAAETQQLLKRSDRIYDALIRQNLVRTGFFDRLDLRKLSRSNRCSGDFIRRLFETIDTGKITRTGVDSVKRLVESGSGRTQFTGGYSAEVSCGFLYIQSKKQRTAWERGISFKENAGTFHSKEIGFKALAQNEGTVFRTFLPGDRFGSKKLKEALLRRRVPRLERRLLPLMLRVNSKEVLWFPGQEKKAPFDAHWSFPFAR